ncbi:hypothetical protein [Allorhodopirellula solitaria]|uniref:Uncharacterized protein n=1 Tax=Allorhodopirellula solitaria TaxID=2527987 RepID=A0A5C5YH05_9BACT|nr:hypothetical protein [Allorhodopirellula solitaria]TWT74283.1 hypothetical protein CA85_11700 [Allorhodopirellula solitaria]
MNRWLLIGSLTGLMALSTGCLHHNTRGGCQPCGTGGTGAACADQCNTGQCNTGQCGSPGCSSCLGTQGGLFGKARGRIAGCFTGSQPECNDGCNSGCNSGCQGNCGGNCYGRHPNCCGSRVGCQAGPLGWQQGGLDYSSHLNPGCMGHQAGQAVASQPFTPGQPSAQVAYPYYTHRGPRDFLMANPPSIGP